MKERKLRALEFASTAHQDRHIDREGNRVPQLRKYSGSPYIVHPIEVGTRASDHLSPLGLSDEGFIVGVLHDVVEDTDVTVEEIRTEFGDDIATMVSFVTDVSRPEDGNRRVRKRIDREHASKGCMVSQTVKVCDIMSNSRSITTDDVSFAAVYVPEKLVALNAFTKAVEEARREAYHMLVDCVLKIEQAGHVVRWDRVTA